VPWSIVSTAAATAPQCVWPSTTKSGVRKWRPAYCKLPPTSGGQNVSRHADDTQLAKPRIEDQFGRHPRIAAAQDCRIGMLALGEISEDFLLHGWESRGPGDETFVSPFESQ